MVGTKASYQVTALGKQKAEEFSLSGPRWQVLAYLAEQGPATVSEIVSHVGMSDEKVKFIVRDLIQNGYVTTVAGD